MHLLHQLCARRSVAQRILECYQAGERNFQNQNLRGADFSHRCLRDADFSQSDLRGANFSGADLSQARFRQVRAGVEPLLQAMAGLMAIAVGLMDGFLSTRIAVELINSHRSEQVSGVISVVILGLLCGLVSRFGLLRGTTTTLTVAAIIGMVTGIW